MTDDTISYYHKLSIDLSEDLDRERSRARDLERTISSIHSDRLLTLPVVVVFILITDIRDCSWMTRISDAVVYGSVMTAWLMWGGEIVTRIYRKFHRDE